MKVRSPIKPMELLAELEAAGYHFRLMPEGKIGVSPPPDGALTPEVRQQLQSHRFELAALLEKRCPSPVSGETEDADREAQFQADEVQRRYKEKWRKTLAQCAPPPDWTEEDEEAHQAYWR